MRPMTVSRNPSRQRCRAHRLSALVLLVTLLTVTVTPPATASMEGELDRFLQEWESQLTVTRPGFYEGQRRGYVTGGALTLRFPRRSFVPFTLSLPRLNAGCGGISAFGGAFSYINMEEFTQFLQNIMQNALGVAFNMALQTLCPQCSKVLGDMEAMVRDLTGSLRGDCQAIKKLLQKAAPDNINEWAQGRCEAIDSALGVVTDHFRGKWDCRELSRIKQADTRGATDDAQNPTKTPMRISRNAFWAAWDKIQGVSPFWDSAFGEQVMSLVGTVIINFKSDDANAPAEIKYVTATPLTVENLLAGWLAEGVSLMKCDEQLRCMNPQEITSGVAPFDGFENMVEAKLLEYASNLESRSPVPPGPLFRIPVAGMPIARLLAEMGGDPGGADHVIGMAKRVIAVRLLDELLTRAIRMVRQEVGRHGNDPAAEVFLDELKDREQAIRSRLGYHLQEMTQVNQNLRTALQLAQTARNLSPAYPSLGANLGFAARMTNPLLQGGQ